MSPGSPTPRTAAIGGRHALLISAAMDSFSLLGSKTHAAMTDIHVEPADGSTHIAATTTSESKPPDPNPRIQTPGSKPPDPDHLVARELPLGDPDS
jgi:hypothetical protein